MCSHYLLAHPTFRFPLSFHHTTGVQLAAAAAATLAAAQPANGVARLPCCRPVAPCTAGAPRCLCNKSAPFCVRREVQSGRAAGRWGAGECQASAEQGISVAARQLPTIACQHSACPMPNHTHAHQDTCTDCGQQGLCSSGACERPSQESGPQTALEVGATQCRRSHSSSQRVQAHNPGCMWVCCCHGYGTAAAGVARYTTGMMVALRLSPPQAGPQQGPCRGPDPASQPEGHAPIISGGSRFVQLL